MGFEITKLAGGLLMPLPVILIFLIAGLVLLMASRFRRIALGLLMLGTALLLVVSIPPLSERSLRALETSYPLLQSPPQAEWIVVLGGGSKGPSTWPATARLGETSLCRIAEGVRLADLLPGATLITSGGSAYGGKSCGELMAEAAAGWGIDPQRIVVHSSPLNTEAEAAAVASRINPRDTVILVTSAFHMRRAVALFEGQGLRVIPAPTGHQVNPVSSRKHTGQYLPQSQYIWFAERVLWERIGLVWAGLRGKALRTENGDRRPETGGRRKGDGRREEGEGRREKGEGRTKPYFLGFDLGEV